LLPELLDLFYSLEAEATALLDCLRHLPELDDYYSITDSPLNLPCTNNNPLSIRSGSACCIGRICLRSPKSAMSGTLDLCCAEAWQKIQKCTMKRSQYLHIPLPIMLVHFCAWLAKVRAMLSWGLTILSGTFLSLEPKNNTGHTIGGNW